MTCVVKFDKNVGALTVVIVLLSSLCSSFNVQLRH